MSENDSFQLTPGEQEWIERVRFEKAIKRRVATKDFIQLWVLARRGVLVMTERKSGWCTFTLPEDSP